ncbi:MAG: response regulator [Proteobacteria bacterium]|nr:response regulator [Pseudomonadota bacterium]
MLEPAVVADARMHLNLATLRFTGVDAALERPFLHDHFRGSLRHMRIALVLGAIMYGGYGLLDHLMFPVVERRLWLVRFAFVCPVILFVAASSFHARFERWMQPALALVIWVSGGGVIVLTVLATPPASYQFYAGLTVVLIFSYAFLRARFLWASATGLVVVVAYNLAVLRWTETPPSVMVSNDFFLITFNFVGMAACYGIEHSARRAFFLRHRLGTEQDKVQEANRTLEARVLARTTDLSVANDQLQREVVERQRVEDERLRLAQQLKQAEKLETIGKLAAGVAHDLNNMLGGLVTLPDLMLSDLDEHDPLRADLVEIRDAGIRAAAIVSDLLALSRQAIPDRSVVQLNRIIEAVVRSPACTQLGASHREVRLEVELDPELLHLVGASVQLSKLVTNLLHNAFEANLVAGVVKITTANRYIDRPMDGYERIPEGEYVVLTVADTGTGIAPEDLSRIFEPFFTKKKLGRSGTGLGMTLIAAALKEHGGFLDLKTAEGEGTAFELYFPATRDELAVADAPARLEDCLGTERVLVVDDVAEQRSIASKMLRKLGYDVHVVESGEVALAYLRQERADIVVLDMVMDPGIDGCEAYRQIVAEHPRQRAILTTGFASSDRVVEALRLGVGACIPKPYTLERLARALRKELARSAA